MDKVDEQRSFSYHLAVDVCIDDSCESISILSQWLVPIPFCNTNGTLALPGGSIDGYLSHLNGIVTEEAISLVLHTLGIKVKYKLILKGLTFRKLFTVKYNLIRYFFVFLAYPYDQNPKRTENFR